MTEGPPMPKPGPPRPRPPAPPAPPLGETPPSAQTEGDGEAARDPRVETVLADLEQLADLPVGEHLAVYERVHAKLREVLQTAGQETPPAPDAS